MKTYKKIINGATQVSILGVIFFTPVASVLENNLKELCIHSPGYAEVVFMGEHRPFIEGIANSAEVRTPLPNIIERIPNETYSCIIVNEIKDL